MGGRLTATLIVGLAGAVLAAAIGSADAATATAPSKRLSRGDEPTKVQSKARSKAQSKAQSKTQPERTPKGPLLIVVSIGDQRVSVFGDGALFARSAVSTGTQGHPTPEGVFSVIQKDRYHHSNIYSGAPMPFMQRITWSGVAMHAGVLPGYPASHGCIRLTYEFATTLWRVTQVGARVIVARNAVEPVEIAHPHLFVPRQKPIEPPVASDPPVKASDNAGPVRFAETSDPTIATDGVAAGAPAPDPPDPPVAPTPVDPPKEGQAPAVQEPVVAAPPKPAETPTIAEAPKPADPAKMLEAAKSEFSTVTLASETPRKKEQVSAFVSRKEGKLFVRQGFLPLFSIPVTIRNPERPLGTHVFTAMELKNDGSAMRWTVVSVAGPHAGKAEDSEPRVKKSQRKRRDEDVVKRQPHEPALTAADALDRIAMPKDAADRISDFLAPGFALIVSDQPISGETNDGTDFIVLTR